LPDISHNKVLAVGALAKAAGGLLPIDTNIVQDSKTLTRKLGKILWVGIGLIYWWVFNHY
jgi:hypothetical protein